MSFTRKNIGQIKHNIYVIRLLAKRDRQRGNSSALLGQLWEIINPFIYMVVMALLFTEMFSNESFKYFPLYILVGTTFYSLFNEGTNGCLNALSGNKNFLINSSISRMLYPIEKVYVSFVNFCFSSIVFLVVALYYGLTPRVEWILVIPNVLIFVIMILGIGKILAIINVTFADITYFYRIFALFIFYASAIFYDSSKLSPLMQKLISFNPVYVSIALARISVIDGKIPSVHLWIKLCFFSIVCHLLGNYIYKKNIFKIVEKI